MIGLLAAAEASGESSPSVLSVPLSEVIIGGVAFFIVFGLLGKVLLPRIATMLQAREDAIEGGLRRAEKAQEESAALKLQYQDQLAEAREDAAAIRQKAQAEKAQIIAEARAEAQDAAAQVAASAQASIEAEKVKALSELRVTVGTLATDLAGKIVGETLTDDARASAVVDRFIAELEETAAQTSGQI
ncbi:MAG: F0F1 ATP synthase subunit B [Actinomycetes bacterium]